MRLVSQRHQHARRPASARIRGLGPSHPPALRRARHRTGDALAGSGVRGSVSAQGLPAYQSTLADYHSTFSDSEVGVLAQIAENGLVATRWEFSATNTGEYLRQSPTGARATWTGIQIDRHLDGLIVESWVDWDKFRLLQHLGLVEQP